jgi:hypothetical protein
LCNKYYFRYRNALVRGSAAGMTDLGAFDFFKHFKNAFGRADEKALESLAQATTL